MFLTSVSGYQDPCLDGLPTPSFPATLSLGYACEERTSSGNPCLGDSGRYDSIAKELVGASRRLFGESTSKGEGQQGFSNVQCAGISPVPCPIADPDAAGPVTHGPAFPASTK